MFRNMVTSLLKHDRIKTTEAKAKELRRWADHIVTLAKRGDLHARRLAMSIVREKDVVYKIFDEAPERFGAINGGYTRIVRIGRRPGDAAPLTIVELVSADGAKPAKGKKAKSAEKAKTAGSERQSGVKQADVAPTPPSAPEDAPAESGGDLKTSSVATEPDAAATENEVEKDSNTAPESDDTTT